MITKMQTNTITILCLLDVVGALSEQTLTTNLYLFDNNKANGSSGEGTGQLKTKVKAGDTLIWTIVALEPESYAAISAITIDPAVCTPVQRMYPESDVSYWEALVLKVVPETPYRITFEIGTKKQPLETEITPTLID
jgi:hypothetical protein